MIKIVQNGDSVLRSISKNVPIKKIGSAEINKLLKDMKKALDLEEDGVAIAAPQIGTPFRIFIVSEKVFGISELENLEENREITSTKNENLIFINPKILKLSKKKAVLEEGCLSVRWKYGNVRRSTNATVEAYDENGKKFTRGAGGLLAQIFQHEVDHLDGILFIDKAKNIKEVTPKK